MNAPTDSDALLLDVEAFEVQHPAMNALLLVEHARVALSEWHRSPAELSIRLPGRAAPGRLAFRMPDTRSSATLQRRDFIEKGAIVVGGLVLHATEGLQLTDVTEYGSRVDYFVGSAPGARAAILEVGGTDRQPLESLLHAKETQLRESRYRRPPYSMSGFVSVTRFAPPAVTCLNHVSCEAV